MSATPFSYQGPAIIGGVAFTEVTLRERRDPLRTLLWTWEGTAVIPLAAGPPLRSPEITPGLQNPSHPKDCPATEGGTAFQEPSTSHQSATRRYYPSSAS